LFLLAFLLSMGAVMFVSDSSPTAQADDVATLVVDCLGDPAQADDSIDVVPGPGVGGDMDDADDPADVAEDDCTDLGQVSAEPCGDLPNDCSLRWAVFLANTNLYHTGTGAHPDRIEFEAGLTGIIQLEGDGDNNYLVLTDQNLVNGTNVNNTKIVGPVALNIQTDPLITVDCDPFGGPNSDWGFIIKSGQNSIENLNIVRCDDEDDSAAILIGGEGGLGVDDPLEGGEDADGNVIIGNTLGTNGAGTDCEDDFGGTANENGIVIDDGPDGNLIGHNGSANPTAAQRTQMRNVISCNFEDGIFLDSDDSDFNVIRNNYIGTSWAGTHDQGNGDDGIDDHSTSGTIIKENLISGNASDGIELDESSNMVLIQGNIIGMDVTGLARLSNDDDGVDIASGTSDDHVIGCDPSAHTALGAVACNSSAPLTFGATRNLISGNGDGNEDNNGIEIDGDASAIGGNYIGVDINGNTATDSGNDGNGIQLEGDANRILIGGMRVQGASNFSPVFTCTLGPCNVIGGNDDDGIDLNEDAFNNRIQGNNIGIGANGTAEVGNDDDGIDDDSEGSTIVGSSSGDLTAPYDDGTVSGGCLGVCNAIAFNGDAGVAVDDEGNADTLIRKNSIFSNLGLGIDLDDDDVVQCPAEDEIFFGGPHSLGHAATPIANDSFEACPVITTGESTGAVSGVITPQTADEAETDPFGFVDIYLALVSDLDQHGEGHFWITATDVDELLIDPQNQDTLHTFATQICIDGPATLTAVVSNIENADDDIRSSEFGPNFLMQEISTCGGVLEIEVDLQGWSGIGCDAPEYCETVVTISGPSGTLSETLPAGEGTATFVVDAGNYTYSITHRGYLSECGTAGPVVVNATTTVNETLRGGDVFTAFDPGTISIFDLAAIAADMGGPYDPASDINGDGVVDILDLSLAAGNFNATDNCP
jgi:hypothetical protein